MALTIKEIRIKNFRNYDSLLFSCLGNMTILIGPNATGKTNVIEALQLTTSLSSLRNATVDQLLKWGTDEGSIEAHMEGKQRDLNIKLELHDGKKSYYLNGKRKRPKEVKGILPSICFTPDDLILIKGPQRIKRKELDTFGAQASMNYQTVRKDYEKVLQHKNHLLKDEEGCSQGMLEAINETLVITGTQFYLYRRSLVEKLIPYIQRHYEVISNQKEKVEAEYLPSWCGMDDQNNKLFSKEEISKQLKESLEVKRDEEFRRRHSLIGPHADKLEFRINGRDAAIYGSQGQQRSLVLSFKFAEVEVVKDITGQSPILLLDDVMSELDMERREALLSFIRSDIQTFITTTHLEYFPDYILEQAHLIDLSKNESSEKR